MIAFIKGEVADVQDGRIILESGNIGYTIDMPASSLDGVVHTGEEVKVHTYLHVREDALQLFGFLTREELAVFRLLLGVNGIGPKAALGILSALSVDELQFAILADDVSTISRAPGIGKKTAQKLILELKDKLDLKTAFEQKLSAAPGVEALPAMEDSRKEAAEALVALGYSSAQALGAVKQVEGAETMGVEELLKAALKKM